MGKRVLTFGMLMIALSLNSQQVIYDTIIHDGLNRSYILFVPTAYSPGVPTPLVFNFHGYGSNAFEQMFYGDFRAISDTAGFLLVHPNGTLDTAGQMHWNANWGTGVDDIGFLSALIDSLSVDYNIDPKRVYSTGMSNGGFMSYTLACALSNRIAAIASVTGSMVVTQIPVCNPIPPIPVMEIHGTADPTVPYNGIPGMVEPIDNVIDYWVNINQCDTTPVFTQVPDINTQDGCSAEHYLYTNGINGAEVEHYKIIGGGHTWPGSFFSIGVTNQDINASNKIWEFFRKYDIDGRITTTGLPYAYSGLDVNVFPNPASDKVKIQWGEQFSGYIFLVNITGREIYNFNIRNDYSLIVPLDDIPDGVYFIRIISEQSRSNKSIKLIKF